MRTFEYRLFVKKQQAHLLMECLKETRVIYNEMLESVKAQYEEKGTFPSKYDLETAFKGQGAHVPATTVQMLADRLSTSLKRFLAARQQSIPAVGFPRFKQPNRWHSIQLRQYGKDAYLHEDKKRQLCRRKKSSHRRRKAARNTAKTHLKIARQRRDFHFKTAKQYTEQYQMIAVEQLHILNMTHNHSLAKSIMDASWGAFLDILSEKAERAGHAVVRVNPRFTSQQCFKCGEIVQKSLSVRTHICPFCGYVADRDVNAAKNILSKARAWPSGTVSAGGPVELRSPQL